VAGWVCDEATNRCVPESSLDAGMLADGGRDAALDAAAVDGSFDGAAPVDDAGSGDAGPADAGADGGAVDSGADAGGTDTACGGPLAGALFCDGFEDGADLAAWMRGSETDGLVTWVEDTVYRGRGALRVETTAPNGQAYVWSRYTPTVGDGDLWLRLYAFFPASSPLDHFNLAGVDPSSGPGGVTLYVYADRMAIWLEESETPFNSSTSPPRDTWTCLELHTVVSDTAGTVEIYVDGVLARAATGIDTRAPMPYGSVSVGLPYTATGQPPTVLYVDEVAVGASRLPCD
jgi:hypothetical protein